MAEREHIGHQQPQSWPEPLNRKVESKNIVKNKLHLDKANGKLLGVCAGLAKWTGIDVNILRIGFFLATIFGVGAPVLIYLAIALIVD